MAKKDFSGANTGRVYDAIAAATAELDDYTEQRLAEIEGEPLDDYTDQRIQEVMEAAAEEKETKEKPKKKANKDTRVTFLLRKKEWEGLRILARLKGTTPNTLINDYIEKLLDDNADVIVKYSKLMKEVQV